MGRYTASKRPWNPSTASLQEIARNIEIIGADPVTRHGFTQVPNFILTNKDLSVGAKLAYAMLLKYAWTDDACFPGQQKLADDIGVRGAQCPNLPERAGGCGLPGSDPARPWQDQPLSPASHRQETGISWGLPAQTGKICRSRPAKLSAPERQNLPLTLYKNTHLRILILKILSFKMHFFKKGIQECKCSQKQRHWAIS